jgi:hypothetical protein
LDTKPCAIAWHGGLVEGGYSFAGQNGV